MTLLLIYLALLLLMDTWCFQLGAIVRKAALDFSYIFWKYMKYME